MMIELMMVLGDVDGAVILFSVEFGDGMVAA